METPQKWSEFENEMKEIFDTDLNSENELKKSKQEEFASQANELKTPETLYRKVAMTLDEVKEQVAKRFTGGKHTWYDGYLNKSIKVILMDSVAKIYASQFETQIEKLEADKEELLEALEASNCVLANCSFEVKGETSYQVGVRLSNNESLIQKHKQ